MGKVIGIDTTYTGNPVSFNAAQGGTMKSIVVPLTQTQDLHGYANPWPGGGGKNKVDISTATITHQTTIYSVELSAGQYTISAYCTNNTSIIGYLSLRLSGVSKGTITIASGDTNTRKSASFTLTESGTYDIVGSGASSGYDFIVSNVQLESGSTMTDFAPYANICPISGLTGLSVYRTGKNLLGINRAEGTPSPASIIVSPRVLATDKLFAGLRADNYYYRGYVTNYSVTDNTIKVTTTNNVNYGVAFPVACHGNTEYTLSATLTRCYMSVGCYDADWNFIQRLVNLSNTPIVTFTTPANAAYITIVFGSSTLGTEGTATNIQLELGSTATTYEPYNGNTYNVDWSTQAGTVYGGTVDVVTGELVVDRGRVNVSSSWYWYKSGSYPGGFYTTIENAGTGQKTNTPFICSHAKTATSISQYVQGTCFCDGSINIRIMGGSDTVQDWKDYINAQITAGTPIQICYELATPVTYQLTPKQITALIGQNYIWSSNNETLNTVLTAPATGFAGWLIKCVTNGTAVEIPLKYMRAETYTVTPDQRMEWSAERDVTGVLHRETVQNLPPKIEFNTPLMTNSDINALNSIIKAAFTNYLQRNITIQFYDPERDQYWEWDCYMPDVKYHIRNADTVNNIINYEELRYAFIGY